MLVRLWNLLMEIRVEVLALTRLVQTLLDRITETESLKTSEAVTYCGLKGDSCLYEWRRQGLVRGSHGRWNRRDLEVILRSRALREFNDRAADVSEAELREVS